MVYSKTTWVNDTSPAINDTNLNHIEDGIYKAQDFDSGEHIGDLPAARFTLNIEAAIAGKNIVPDTIVINNVTDEAGSLKIYGKDADVLILGDATHEGGDVSIYEDASGNKSLSFNADTGNLILGNVSSEIAKLIIYGKNINGLALGDATHEGGNIAVYRDTLGNTQFVLDADAASNAIALSVYGGVIAQNHLTVGQTALDAAYTLAVKGTLHSTGTIYAPHGVYAIASGYGIQGSTNVSGIFVDIPVTDAGDHQINLRIDSNNIISIQATGDGAGSITNEAIGVFGVTPQVQQNHIADPTDLATCISALSTLLADMEGYGWLKSS